VKNSSYYWEISVAGYRIGSKGKNVKSSKTAIFDSGTNFIYMPSSIGKTILNSILGNTYWIDYNGYPMVNCYGTYESLYLNLGDSTYF
jgi:hypothetical protein